MTSAEKWIADYAGISLYDVDDMCYYDYLVILRDAVIYQLSKTESGREYLENCWRIEQTEPDRNALREKMGMKKREK
jgi:hypothetical protein